MRGDVIMQRGIYLATPVLVCAMLAACSTDATTGVGGPSPARERATVTAGVDSMPIDAKLTIKTGFVADATDSTTRTASRKTYAEHVGLALGLIARYLQKPYTKGKFTVTPDSGPGRTTLGRAAAATTAAIAALDLAIAGAPTALRQATLVLRHHLTGVDRGIRGGSTVAPATAGVTDRLVVALISAGATERLRLHRTATPNVAPLPVIPRWKAVLKKAVRRVVVLTNSALADVRRYVLRPQQQGKFSASTKPRTARRAQHRAAEALDYAIAQLATAAQSSAGIARLSSLREALLHAREVLQPALALARQGRLNGAQALTAASTISLLAAAGVPARLKIHPGRGRTFLT